MHTRTFRLKLTSAIVINGIIATAGSEVDLDEPTAKDLLHRGRAELAFASASETAHQEQRFVDLSKANKKTLLQIARDKGISPPEKATNAELIALIEADGSADDTDDFDNLDDDKSDTGNENNQSED